MILLDATVLPGPHVIVVGVGWVSNHAVLLKDKFDDSIIHHDVDSSFYFATLITDNADQINLKYNLAVHYPLLHKTQYYNNTHTLTNTEQLHLKIVNLPLYDINIYNS